MKKARLLFLGVACMLTLAASGTVVESATFCTKETCSAARAECREWCSFPCTMNFQCTTPYCGSCISCTC